MIALNVLVLHDVHDVHDVHADYQPKHVDHVTAYEDL